MRAVSELPIYLDYNATTPIAAEVLDAMLPVLRTGFGNPSSAHAYGEAARGFVERARGHVATLLECSPDEVIFTSGGTESNNAALIGIAEATQEKGRHLITSAVEHPAVAATCGYLETRGWEVTRIAVDRDGRIRLDELARTVRPETTLISIMHANNETGVLQPIEEIRESIAPLGPILHTDAAQSVGKIDCRVDRLGVDALTIAGHKLYGPKGVGALYLRSGTPCERYLHGAEHEIGRRAGTENVAQIVGLGRACELAVQEGTAREQHLADLRDRLEMKLRTGMSDLVVHGGAVPRLPNTLYVAIPRTSAIELLDAIPEIAAAAGSACDAGKPHVSDTLRAMGVEESIALATLRLTVGRSTTVDEIERASNLLVEAAQRLRGFADG
jgi:cysteine desulfurase